MFCDFQIIVILTIVALVAPFILMVLLLREAIKQESAGMPAVVHYNKDRFARNNHSRLTTHAPLPWGAEISNKEGDEHVNG